MDDGRFDERPGLLRRCVVRFRQYAEADRGAVVVVLFPGELIGQDDGARRRCGHTRQVGRTRHRARIRLHGRDHAAVEDQKGGAKNGKGRFFHFVSPHCALCAFQTKYSVHYIS